MKRLNNLYDNMISYSNVNYVYNKVKNNCHNKEKVFEFLKYKNCNIIDILEKLKKEEYIFSKYNIFLIHEKKYIIIMSENISDKIVNQMISYFILLPAFKNLIDTNVATRKNKGTSYAYNIIEKYVRSIGLNNEIFVLKIDINKYFYNINHEILYNMIKRRIKDKKSLKIIKNIINLTDEEYINNRINKLVSDEIYRINKLSISQKEKNKKINELKKIPLYEKDRGISIGCLSNQILALFYLNDIDHYIKEELKHKYYIRYQDDLYIFDKDIDRLKQSFFLIKRELNKLKLNINNKSGIYNLKNGISYLGYTYFVKNNSLVIKYTNNTIRKINRKLNKLYNSDFNLYYKSINSYKGYFKKCNTNLYYYKYRLLELNSKYDKYKLLKKRFNDSIIFIKSKDRYYTYQDDLKYLNNIFNTKRRSFVNRDVIKIENINYVILNSNDIFEKYNLQKILK